VTTVFRSPAPPPAHTRASIRQIEAFAITVVADAHFVSSFFLLFLLARFAMKE